MLWSDYNLEDLKSTGITGPFKILSRLGMYEKERCPDCKAMNLVYLGDWSDCTYPDVEAAECWSCGNVFLMGDEDNQRDTLSEIILAHCEEEIDQDALFEDKSKLSNFLKEYAFTQKGEECK